MGATADLDRVLADIAAARRSLLATISPLSAPDLSRARAGGWTVRRILQHVIESEAVYAKLLAHQCSRVAPESDTSEPADGADAARKLDATAASVAKLIDGIDDETLYRLVRFGHEEYSPLSVLENIAAHDIDHQRQIAGLLAERSQESRAATVVASDVHVRPASAGDLAAITEIYNHYVEHTPVTFDLEPVTLNDRRGWFRQFAPTGRHRIFVAEGAGQVVGYAGSHQFRTKAAYDTTVETTVYLRPEACGRGAGTALYRALFDVLADEDVHVAIAGITLPNEPSVALHERFGFVAAGVMHAVGRKFGQYWDVGWYERLMPDRKV